MENMQPSDFINIGIGIIVSLIIYVVKGMADDIKKLKVDNEKLKEKDNQHDLDNQKLIGKSELILQKVDSMNEKLGDCLDN
jgi:hypothetical protein